MRIDIVTLFPEMCENILNESIIGRARARGYLQVCCHQLRDHGEGVHKRVDDCTFGGGKGMLLMAQPIAKAFDEIIEQTAVRPHIVYMSPRGRVLDQEKVKELAKNENIIVLCGHYEGVDERVLEEYDVEEISIGDFVLTGGELPAVILTDAVARMLPGVLSEDVTDEMTKYDLVAIPVCDENRHILGIVTFDDAMDVIAEEHQEDLQIAGVGSGDSASDDSTNVLSWFVHRQYWVVVWGIASCIMATVLGTALGSAHLVVFPMCAMPLVLLAASRMVSFVKNYFLEYDGHDDEPKPYLGFFFQSTGMGLILSLVTYLCAQLVRTAAFLDAPMFEEQLFTGCFNIAAIICLAGNMSAVIYLMVLFWRDEHDLNTSGTAMNVIAVMISCVAYCAAAVLLTMSVMG